MLDDGRGGMGDYGKYREYLTNAMWKGIIPEQTPEERKAAAKASVGAPPAQSLMDEAKAIYDQAVAAKALREAAEK